MIYIEDSNYQVFKQLASVIAYELKTNGIDCKITSDTSLTDGTWILFFSAFYSGSDSIPFYKRLAAPYIVVQTENMGQSVIINNQREAYNSFLKNAKYVWDYVTNFKLGFSKIYQIEFEETKDIDVLFYGWVNERRRHVLSQIPNATIVEGGKDAYMPNLWNYIRRSKIVLIINFYDPSNPDPIRVTQLLSCRTFIIAEKTKFADYDKNTEFILADYEQIPKLCEYYLKNPLERVNWIERGYTYIKNNPIHFPNSLVS